MTSQDTARAPDSSGGFTQPESWRVSAIRREALRHGIIISEQAISEGGLARADLAQVVEQELLAQFPRERLLEDALRFCRHLGFSEILTTDSLKTVQTALYNALLTRLGNLFPCDIRTEVLLDWCSSHQPPEAPVKPEKRTGKRKHETFCALSRACYQQP